MTREGFEENEIGRSEIDFEEAVKAIGGSDVGKNVDTVFFFDSKLFEFSGEGGLGDFGFLSTETFHEVELTANLVG